MDIFDDYKNKMLGKTQTAEDKEVENLYTRQVLDFIVKYAPEILRNSDNVSDVIVNVPIFWESMLILSKYSCDSTLQNIQNYNPESDGLTGNEILKFYWEAADITITAKPGNDTTFTHVYYVNGYSVFE